MNVVTIRRSFSYMEVIVKNLTRTRFINSLATLSALAFAGALNAQQITLTSPDGLFSASGNLVSLEDGIYTISTTLGNMQISAETVTCEGANCPSLVEIGSDIEVDLRFAGSNTVGSGLMPLLIAGYAASHNASSDPIPTSDGTSILELIADEGYGEPIGVFQVDPSNSTSGFEELLANEAGVGMASRRILREEARALAQDGAGSMIALEQEHIVAVDSVVVIVNPSNPVDSISVSDLQSIFRGSVTNWSEVGGPDLPITVYSRSESAATRDFFDTSIFGAPQAIQIARIAGTDDSMAAKVSGSPGAIGFVGYAFINNAKPVSLVSQCGIVSSPDVFSAKTEEYLLERRLYLYTREDTISDTASEFLDFALSTEADGVIEKSGYIGLGISRISQELARERMQATADVTSNAFELDLMRDLLLELFQWDRLSTTFRFASGSNNLERKSVLDLDRLVEYLMDATPGTRVALVGFTDSDGVFNSNRTLSNQRAARALQEIENRAAGQLDHVTFETFGFGELAPADCNSASEGKRINRRVEVWIRD